MGMPADVLLQLVDKVAAASEVAVPQNAAGQGGEEQLDLVVPGSVRRGPADVPARVRGQPGAGVPGGVGGAVVEHNVYLLSGCDRPVELIQEGGESQRVVAADHLGEDLAGADVQSGDERGGAVASILELLSSWLPGAGRPPRMTARAGGDRGLLVDGQDDRALGRVEVEGAHGGGALPEVRGVPADKPAADPVRLQIQTGQDPADLGGGDRREAGVGHLPGDGPV